MGVSRVGTESVDRVRSVERRLSALLIDVVLLTVASMFLLDITDGKPISRAVIAAMVVLYFPLSEGGATGQTRGKQMVGIRVTDTSGAPLGYPRAAARTLVKCLSVGAVGIGCLWVLRGPEHQTWHDRVAGAMVVDADREET